MNRGKGFARGKTAAAKKDAKAKRPAPLVPKRTGERTTGKLDHRRSKDHLALVRSQGCLITRRMGAGVQAHHPFELIPAQVAKSLKVNDFLAVPLFIEKHDPRFPGSLHHHGASEGWWAKNGWPADRVLGWIITLLRQHYRPGQHEGVDEALDIACARRARLLEVR